MDMWDFRMFVRECLKFGQADEIIKILTEENVIPQGDCKNCDFRKFSEKFVGGVVDVMNKNGITNIEQLFEILRDGAK